MTQAEFLKRLAEEHQACVEISRKKNADYASGEDAFQNFRVVQHMGIADVCVGILTRMSDKFQRIANLSKREAQVTDESIADTLRDLSNYSLILLLYMQSQRPTANKFVPMPDPNLEYVLAGPDGRQFVRGASSTG